MRIATCAIVAAAAAGTAWGQISLIPDTIIGANVDRGTLEQYDFAGNLIATVGLGGSFSTPIGVAVLNGDLYLGGVSGDVGLVDLNTGVVSPVFTAGSGIEALQSAGGEFLHGDWGGDALNRYDAAGNFLGTIPGGFQGNTGVDSDGTRVFRANYNDGNVYVSDLGGNALYSFSTGFGGFSVSDAAFDPRNDTLWVASGFGSDVIAAFDASTGALLTSFSAPGWVNGIEVVIPAPGSLGLLAAAGLVAVRRRR